MRLLFRNRAGALSLAVMVVVASPALAQVVPAPALDQPSAPLAGPPLNQPPRQLAPESDPSSDPAMAGTHRAPMTLGASRAQRRCLRLHHGYDVRTNSYPDARGRQKFCG